MEIYVTSVFVDDQAKALEFYTNILGFETKRDITVGDYRWLTVTGKNAPNGTELLLEPGAHPAVGPYRSALITDGIPAASFRVQNLDEEHARLTGLGVAFTQEPAQVIIGVDAEDSLPLLQGDRAALGSGCV